MLLLHLKRKETVPPLLPFSLPLPMASESRARDGEDDDDDGRGSGGKLLRRRRREAASPYHRQEEASMALASSQTEAKGWFSGIGRFFSSVFGSESGSSSSCSCSSESDSEDPDVGEYRDGLHRDGNTMDEPGTKLELIESQGIGHQLLAPTNKTKLLIEKLLQQEIYSRDESKRLMELIQSRVVESPTMKNGKDRIGVDFPIRATYGSISSPRVLGSSRLHNYLHGSPDSPNYLSSLYPSSFVDQVRTPLPTSAAIIEAKKWVEEKRLTSSSKSGLSCGPCTLNTDPFHHELEGDKGSPVDIAKSYMQALPPWRSPISSSIGFRTPSSVAPKRSHLEAASWDALDVTRYVHQKIDAASPPVLATIGSSKKMLDLEPSHTSSAACERVERVFGAASGSNSLQTKSLLDATENAKDGCPDVTPSTAAANGTKHSLPSNNETFITFDNNVSASEEALHVGHESSAATPLPSETKVQDESFASDHATETDQVVDLEEPSPVEEQAGTITVHKPFVAEHNGGLVEDALNAEPIAVLPGNITCTLLSSEEIPVTDVGASSLQKRPELENFRRGDNSAGCHPVPDARSDDENNQIQKKPINLPSRVAASNGVFSQSGSSARAEAADVSADSHGTGNKKNKTSNDDLGGDVSGDTCNVSGETSVEVLDGFEKTTMKSKPQRGVTMKSIKQMLRELPPNSSRGRGRKVVTRSQRGRGRGK